MRTSTSRIGETKLIKAAVTAARHSYSPYSRFAVGAALLADDGRVFAGCNVENASYGLTLCAERTAIGAAVSAGCRRFTALAVAGGKRRPARPCGACLQVLAEFCPPDLPIFLASLAPPRTTERFALRDLLPHAFGL
jgi:homotetrameric cytidine deaminase